MSGATKTDILDYGIRVFRPRHKEIRRLKRDHTASLHGFRVWPSSWLIMDFLKRQGLPYGTRVMDVGCGWGSAGIYCAKNHGAKVTGVDKDPEVFPFLRLHANINKVKIATMEKEFDGLRCEHLKNIDVLIGSDICFWYSMIGSLKRLIHLALGSGVRQVVIADPGRTTFEELADSFSKNDNGGAMDWTVEHPYPIKGRIFKIGPLPDNTPL